MQEACCRPMDKRKAKTTFKFVLPETTTNPIESKMLVPLLKNQIHQNPGMSEESIRTYLRQYARTCCLTSFIIKEARKLRRLEVFGSPEENVMRALQLGEVMENMGHKWTQVQNNHC